MSSTADDNFKVRPTYNDEPGKTVPPYEPVGFFIVGSSRSVFKNLEGGCSCHEVSWLTTLPALHLDLCYCKQCQKVSAAPVMAWLAVPRASMCWDGLEKIRWQRNRQNLAWRGYCERCGNNVALQYHCYPDKTVGVSSRIPERKEGQPEPWVPERVGCHIWTSEKPSWYQIADDGVVRHDKFDPEFLEVQKKYLAERPDGEAERDRAEASRAFEAKYGRINPDALVFKRPRRR